MTAGRLIRREWGHYRLTCGKCEAVDRFDGGSMVAERRAIAAGWIPGRGHDLGIGVGWICPACAFRHRDRVTFNRAAADPCRLAVQFFAGYQTVRKLRRAAREHGAGAAELAAIERLDTFRAEQADIDRLRPLAELAGVELPTVAIEVRAARPEPPEIESGPGVIPCMIDVD